MPVSQSSPRIPSDSKKEQDSFRDYGENPTSEEISPLKIPNIEDQDPQGQAELGPP